MPTAHHHGLVLFGRRETLSSALFLYRAFGPDAGLRVVEISVLTMPPGKSSHELVRIRQLVKPSLEKRFPLSCSLDVTPSIQT